MPPFKSSLSNPLCKYFTEYLFQLFRKHVGLAFFPSPFLNFQGKKFYPCNSSKALLQSRMPEYMQGFCLTLAQVKILHHNTDWNKTLWFVWPVQWNCKVQISNTANNLMINPQKKKTHQIHLNSKLKGITICLQIFYKVNMGLNCSLKLCTHS